MSPTAANPDSDAAHEVEVFDRWLQIGTEGGAITSTENPEPWLIHKGLGALQPAVNIQVYLIPVDNVAIVEHWDDNIVGIKELTRGYAFPDDRVVFMPVAGESAPLVGPSATQAGRVIGRTAHEIGHILVGGGHSDQYSDPDRTSPEVVGIAPLPGTDPRPRLMHSGVGLLERNLDEFGKQLVKKEWDEADVWMEEEEQRVSP